METMDPEECVGLLKASRFGDLALCHEGRAYVLPLFFGYDGDHVYFHCHPGAKDEYIGSTKEACLVATHVESADVWESVHVFGPIEKVTLTDEIQAAESALFDVPFPPAKGHYPKGRPVRTRQGMYYLKLKPTHIHGRQSAFKESG